MTPDEFLTFAKTCATQSRVRLSRHGHEQMQARRATAADVRAAILSATRARHQPVENAWKLLGGTDIDGDDLTVVVAVDRNDSTLIRVVTVF